MLIFPPERVCSVYENFVCAPTGLAYLASVIRGKYEVMILDAKSLGYDNEVAIDWNFSQFGLSYENILSEIEKFAPQVVGLSCLFSNQFDIIKELCQKIKKLSPEIVTVTGGTHPSFLPAESLQRAPEIDYIIIGEGEESFPQLLEAIEKGFGLEQIDGLAWREKGEPRVNPKTKFIQDLDTLPFPARDLLPMDLYFKVNMPFMFYAKSPRNVSFSTSRGCPFKCAFCSSCNYWGNRIRYRSIGNVMSELREIIAKFRIEDVKFEEDNLLVNRKRAKKLFKAMIEEKLKLTWNMPNGAYIPSLLDEELVKLMKESGCFEVIMAFETGTQEVMDKIIHKPLDLKIAERAIANLRANDIDIHAFFIVGFPGETKEQIKNTFRFARKIGLDHSYVFMFNPLPGSTLYQECIDKGYYDREMVYRANYGNTGLTTDQFNPTWLRKRQYAFTVGQNLEMMFHHPVKLFTKYMGRVANPQHSGAITRALRGTFLSFIKD
jgi:magnesium-protoporphyrin IX monomethyl ester (oxidative) cyclase